MELSQLFRSLGYEAVAAACGVGRSAVSNWVHRGVPPEHHITVWKLALDAGLDWAPPGAEQLRDKLCAVPPKQDAA